MPVGFVNIFYPTLLSGFPAVIWIHIRSHPSEKPLFCLAAAVVMEWRSLLRKCSPQSEAPFSCIFNTEPHLLCVYTEIALKILQWHTVKCVHRLLWLPEQILEPVQKGNPQSRDQDVLETGVATQQKKQQPSTIFWEGFSNTHQHNRRRVVGCHPC